MQVAIRKVSVKGSHTQVCDIHTKQNYGASKTLVEEREENDRAQRIFRAWR